MRLVSHLKAVNNGLYYSPVPVCVDPFFAYGWDLSVCAKTICDFAATATNTLVWGFFNQIAPRYAETLRRTSTLMRYTRTDLTYHLALLGC